jgi:hypothetical protein
MKREDSHPDLTDVERRALRALAEGPEPPPELAAATLRRLEESGLIATALRRRPARRIRLLAAAAALVLFALGLGAGIGLRPGSRPAPAPATPRFALFLYDAPDERELTGAQMRARVDEYRSWARGVRAAGREISGEKLESGGRVLGPSDAAAGRPPAGGWELGGYFVISAPDLEAAIAVAQSCPHVKHGGRIEVRAIART